MHVAGVRKVKLYKASQHHVILAHMLHRYISFKSLVVLYWLNYHCFPKESQELGLGEDSDNS